MCLEIDPSQYLFRPSIYSLVELSLLAKMYAQFGVPRSPLAMLDKGLVSRTLLMMKATENEGHLQVAIYGSDPIGFFWIYQDKPMALCVLPAHQGKGLEARLKQLM